MFFNSNRFVEKKIITTSHFQVGDESFLVIVNDILASGEVPNLIPDDDFEDIMLGLAPVVKSLGLEDNRENCWKFFIERVRKQLKVSEA